MATAYCVSNYSTDTAFADGASRDTRLTAVATKNATFGELTVNQKAAMSEIATVSGYKTQAPRNSTQSDCFGASNFIDVTRATANQEHALGTKYHDGDRVYRYCLAVTGGAAIGPGDAISADAQAVAVASGNRLSTANLVSAAGTYTVTFTENGVGVITANQFQDGYFFISDSGTGGALDAGYSYKIRSNTACAQAGACTITLYQPLAAIVPLNCPRLYYFKNPYRDVVIMDTATFAQCLGISQATIAMASTARFFWVQSRGQAAVRGSNTITPVIDEQVVVPGAQDGRFALNNSTGTGGLQMLGTPQSSATATTGNGFAHGIAIGNLAA